MKWIPRRRRARMWAGVYVGLFGSEGEDAENNAGASDDVDDVDAGE